MKRLYKILILFVKWIKLIFGISYYHQPQNIGKIFKPGQLLGYFNDLTNKTLWNGEVDENGIPINVLDNGKKIYFITTIVQKALGHWDRWLLNNNITDKKEFLKLCRWLLRKQDEKGGWPIWSELGINLPSPYSAMTQGECVSAFVRAWKLTGDLLFKNKARKALNIMCNSIENNGTSIIENDFIFLEEFPNIPRITILNGWIFAIFGLYDYWIEFRDKEVFEFFKISIYTLKNHLYEYDSGFWSYYDNKKHLASTFYHKLHINQLIALSMINNDPLFVKYLNRWIYYNKKILFKIKAIILKFLQKIKDSKLEVIIK